jgi:hypothetical protein
MKPIIMAAICGALVMLALVIMLAAISGCHCNSFF